MGLFDKFFGSGRGRREARAAELKGDLARAAELYGEANDLTEAARIFVLRGDGEQAPAKRRALYAQAMHLAPEGSDIAKLATKRHATLVLALVGEGPVTQLARHEITEAAEALERAGEFRLAAAAYARVHDTEGQARALCAGGEVDHLEYVLGVEQHEARVTHEREASEREAELLVSSGDRRGGLRLLEALADASPSAPSGYSPSFGPSSVHGHAPGARTTRERAAWLRTRKVTAPLVTCALGPDLGGGRFTFILGDEVIIGRTEGSLMIPSSAVSRRHLRIYRGGGGGGAGALVQDLGSRNGTTLRGIALSGELPVGQGLDLLLGHEVPVQIAPCPRFAGATRITLGDVCYVAWLGPTRLRPDEGAPEDVALALTAGDDGWVELRAVGKPLFLDGDALGDVTTLLYADAIALARGRPPALTVLASEAAAAGAP